MRARDPAFVIPLSFLAGVLLTLAPIPPQLAWWRPEWLLMLVIFWVFNQPSYVGIWTAFALGLVMDLVMGARLGLHPASFVVVAWLARVVALRLRVLSWSLSGAVMVMLTALALAIRYVLEMIYGNPPQTFQYALPIIGSALCWPVVSAILQRWGKY